MNFENFYSRTQFSTPCHCHQHKISNNSNNLNNFLYQFPHLNNTKFPNKFNQTTKPLADQFIIITRCKRYPNNNFPLNLKLPSIDSYTIAIITEKRLSHRVHTGGRYRYSIKSGFYYLLLYFTFTTIL